MDYEGTGRKLGTGVKVLRRLARQRAEERAASPTATMPNREPLRPPAQIGRAAGEGARRFGQAVAKPLVKTGHVLWLEVTGCFFALFALGFIAEAWKTHTAWRAGPEHGHFLAYAACAAIFIYFGATSFLRARRRSRR